MSKTWLPFGLALVLLALAGTATSTAGTEASTAGSPNQSTWSIANLDLAWGTVQNHYAYTGIATDGQSRVHISYKGNDPVWMERAFCKPRYASNESGLWATDPISTPFGCGGRENAIAVDPAGHSHISFSFNDGANEDLYYATNASGAWVTEVVTAPGTLSIGLENDIAVDSGGAAHISHWRWNDWWAFYSTNRSGTWVTEPVKDAMWQRTAIELDHTGEPHLALNITLPGFTHEVAHLQRVGDAWQSETIEPDGDIPQAAMDEQDALHVAYVLGNDLWYATNRSGTWAKCEVAAGVAAVYSSHSIAVDASARAHISYYDSNTQDLVYAYGDCAGWTIEAVDAEGGAGLSNAIAVDQDGVAHISYLYQGEITPTLRYATNGPAAYEQYRTGDDAACAPVFGSALCGQTFRTAAAHAVDRVLLKLYRRGLPGTLSVTLRSVDAAGRPTRTILATGTTDGNALPTAKLGQWVTVSLTPVHLDADTGYAVVLEAPSGTAENAAYWRWDRTAPGYAGGSAAYSSSGGRRWVMLLANDLAFAIKGPPCLPGIELTSVPAYGSSDNLQGRVSCVLPDDYRVAVFIRTFFGWFNKPTWAEPLTPIQADGTWTADITTGMGDEWATGIAAFLVPAAYPVPILDAGTFPDAMTREASAYVSVDRPPRTIQFAGIDWWVKKSSGAVDPGPCVYSDDPSDVWVDAQGNLHLRIAKQGDTWVCTEVIGVPTLGYGTYTFVLSSRVDQLDPNVVLGLFTFDETAPAPYREIDIEASRWGEVGADNLQYVVQPYDAEGNRHRWMLSQTERASTHLFDWGSAGVLFASYQGSSLPPDPGTLVQEWQYTGPDVPAPGAGHARMNLWLFGGEAPTNGQGVQVVVKAFQFEAEQ